LYKIGRQRRSGQARVVVGQGAALDKKDQSEHSAPVAETTGDTQVTGGSQGRVLVIDDDEDHRSLLATALIEDGFEFVEAANGRSAIDYLLQNPEPDIILLDLLMPVASGWEVLNVLRTYLRLRRVPVIIVSGEPATVQVPGADVVARLRKPYRLHELQALIKRHIRRPRRTPPSQTQT
jgi:CheY-like chemotaxis protein